MGHAEEHPQRDPVGLAPVADRVREGLGKTLANVVVITVAPEGGRLAGFGTDGSAFLKTSIWRQIMLRKDRLARPFASRVHGAPVSACVQGTGRITYGP